MKLLNYSTSEILLSQNMWLGTAPSYSFLLSLFLSLVHNGDTEQVLTWFWLGIVEALAFKVGCELADGHGSGQKLGNAVMECVG